MDGRKWRAWVTLLGLTLGCVCPWARAQEGAAVSEPFWASRESRLYLGVGALAHDLGEYAGDPSGQTSFLNSAYAELLLMGRFPIGVGGRWSVLPFVTFTPIGHESPEGGQTTRILRLGARTAYSLDSVDFLLGLGLLNWIVSGSGGTVTLDNGNSTAVFGLPSDSSTARILSWEAGVGLRLWRMRWENSVLMTGTFSDRAAWSFVSQLSYGVF